MNIKKLSFLSLIPLYSIIHFHPTYTKFITIETDNQYTTLMQQHTPVLLQFSARWCGACNQIKTAVESVAHEPAFDSITVARIDVDAHPALAKAHNIVSIPTFIYLKDGTTVEQYTGTKNAPDIHELLRTDITKNLLSLSAPEKSDAPPSLQEHVNKNPLKSSSEQTYVDRIKDLFISFFNFIVDLLKKIIAPVQDL